MPSYQEIEDLEELKELSELLKRRVAKGARHSNTRTVGYPSGWAEFPVNFESKTGSGVLWWSSRLSDNEETMINLIGRGDPQSNSSLFIDLQFNIPLASFSRRQGGAFVRDIETGDVFLAHRGIVTRGKSRVAKEKLLQETSATTSTVFGSSRPKELFLVASLNSTTLLHDIGDFSQEIRRAAGVVMNASSTDVQTEPSPSTFLPNIDLKVGDYVDEFSGRRKLPARQAGVAIVRHGSVVKQLAEMLKEFGKLYNSTLVDLALVTKKSAYLFEVKTSIDRTSIYTAIGQLSLHSIALSGQFSGKAVHKILVLPGVPSSRIKRDLRDVLAIEILTYEWGGAKAANFNSAPIRSLID